MNEGGYNPYFLFCKLIRNIFSKMLIFMQLIGHLIYIDIQDIFNKCF